MNTTTHLVNGFKFITAELISNAYVNTILIVMIILGYSYIKWENREINKFASKLKGPKAYPLIGIAYKFIGTHERKEYDIIQLIYCVFNLIIY